MGGIGRLAACATTTVKFAQCDLTFGWVSSRSWVETTAGRAALRRRYEWLQNRPPQPKESIGYGPAERLKPDPPTYFPTYLSRRPEFSHRQEVDNMSTIEIIRPGNDSSDPQARSYRRCSRGARQNCRGELESRCLSLYEPVPDLEFHRTGQFSLLFLRERSRRVP